jgi:hypothetical protein
MQDSLGYQSAGGNRKNATSSSSLVTTSNFLPDLMTLYYDGLEVLVIKEGMLHQRHNN